MAVIDRQSTENILSMALGNKWTSNPFLRRIDRVDTNASGGYAAISTKNINNDGIVRFYESASDNPDEGTLVVLKVHKHPQYAPVMFGTTLDGMGTSAKIRVSVLILPQPLADALNAAMPSIHTETRRVFSVVMSDYNINIMFDHMGAETNVYYFVTPTTLGYVDVYTDIVNTATGSVNDKHNAFKLSALLALISVFYTNGSETQPLPGTTSMYSVVYTGLQGDEELPVKKRTITLVANGLAIELPDGFAQGAAMIIDRMGKEVVTISEMNGIKSTWLHAMLDKGYRPGDMQARRFLLHQAELLRKVADTYLLMARLGLKDDEQIDEIEPDNTQAPDNTQINDSPF